jgi:hypothetical protein
MRLFRCGTSGSRAKSCRPRATAGRLNRGTAALALCAAVAVPGVASAESLPPVESAPPTGPPTSAVSAWDAPEPWRTDRFYLETSVYTRHFNYDPAHDDHQNLVLGEWNVTEQWLVGASFFDNSFGQSSQYVYGGYRFRPFEKLQPLYVKVSAGLVHGYSGEYQDKIPLNASGIAPVIVPSIGYCFSRYCSELVIFGTAGLLVTVGVTIP